MTTARPKADEPKPAATPPGDNRGAEDLDGNKAGARAGNKTPGPDEPETETQPKDKPREPPS
jgi:hypothetical protein